MSYYFQAKNNMSYNLSHLKIISMNISSKNIHKHPKTMDTSSKTIHSNSIPTPWTQGLKQSETTQYTQIP